MRSLLALLGLVAITWLEFQVYPGHSYLKGETQFYLPMLERLDAPGFLSRDLVATNPTFAYTIYDEVTLAMHQLGRLPFERALEWQQLLFRFAAVLGIYLLIRAASLGIVSGLLLTALTSAGLVQLEPVPTSFAFGLVLLAMGCLADEKPLLSGLFGGLALLYEPVIAAAFWLILFSAFLYDRRLRHLLRPTLPVLLVFCLLLANVSQLQPGLGSVQSLTSRLTPAMRQLSRMRTPQLWPGRETWIYLFLFICTLWASERIWARLKRPLRWLTLGSASIGVLSIALSALLLDRFNFALAAQMPPQRLRTLVPLMASIVGGVAAVQAGKHRQFKQAIAWAFLVVAVAVSARRATQQIGEPLRQFADWAEKGTWGSSMFLFPDAGRSDEPGAFRALSRRALWVDWQSGVLVNYSDQAGQDWWLRWQQTMQAPYSLSRLQSFLALPVDYYVLRPEHRLHGIRPAFENSRFIAYDAQDLRNAPLPLR